MLPIPSQAPSFTLEDLVGNQFSLSGDTSSLVCFIKEDCPTCKLVTPLLEQLHQQGAPIIAIGQTAEGNQSLTKEFELTLPVLDDSKQRVSFAYEIDTRHRRGTVHRQRVFSRIRPNYSDISAR